MDTLDPEIFGLHQDLGPHSGRPCVYGASTCQQLMVPRYVGNVLLYDDENAEPHLLNAQARTLSVQLGVKAAELRVQLLDAGVHKVVDAVRCLHLPHRALPQPSISTAPPRGTIRVL